MKKIVLLAISPFSYIYNSQKYYQAGDRLIFSYEKDRAEIEYLLSSEFKNFVVLDKFNSHSEMVSFIEEQIEIFETNLKMESIDLTNYNNNGIHNNLPIPATILEVEDKSANNKQVVKSTVKPKLSQAEKKYLRYSQEELEKLSWRKIKYFVEKKENLDYTNKDEAIELLLSLNK